MHCVGGGMGMHQGWPLRHGSCPETAVGRPPTRYRPPGPYRSPGLQPVQPKEMLCMHKQAFDVCHAFGNHISTIGTGEHVLSIPFVKELKYLRTQLS